MNREKKGTTIKLQGFDGTTKKTYRKFNVKKILKDIDDMSMGGLRKKPKSLSLYVDYNPKNTILGEDNYQNAINIDKKLPLLLKQSDLIKKKSIEILELTKDKNWGDLIKNT